MMLSLNHADLLPVQTAWTQAAPALAGASVHAEGNAHSRATGLDIGHLSDLANRSTRQIAQGATTKWAWKALAGSGAVGRYTAANQRNTTDTELSYFAHDDIPNAIIGDSPQLRVGARGYWVKADAAHRLVLSGSTTAMMEIATELDALSDGWNGIDSLAPSDTVRADIAEAFAHLVVTQSPDIEVDDDGSVALLWDGSDYTFAMTFMGNGRVVGTISPMQTALAPWAIPVSNFAELQERLGTPQIASLIA